MKVVINTCTGKFSLSPKATKRFFEVIAEDLEQYSSVIDMTEAAVYLLDNIDFDLYEFDFSAVPRTCLPLIKAIEEVGCEAASGKYSKLKIIELPDDVKFTILDEQGKERIVEAHRTWE